MRAALINGSKVENVIVIERLEDFVPHAGLMILEVPENIPAGPGWEYRGGVFIPPALPIPEDVPAPAPQIVTTATASLSVQEGEITGFETAAGIGFGMELEPGKYWLFFTAPEADIAYVPSVQAPGFIADISERNLDYFEVTVLDRQSLELATPAMLWVSVQRVR